jgi:hypothetical protein
VRKVQITPARIVGGDRSINFGTYRTPFKNANILDAPLYPFPVPGFWKKFRLKEWQHFGIITPTHYFGLVIFDTKFMGISFFYAFDRLKNTRFEHARRLAGPTAQVARQVYDDTCRFDAKGYRLRFENKLNQGFHRILIDIDGDSERPAVKGEITVHEDLDASEPLVQISPINPFQTFLYTQSGCAGIGRHPAWAARDYSSARHKHRPDR